MSRILYDVLITFHPVDGDDGKKVQMRDCPAKWRKSVFIFTMTLTLLFFIVAYTYYISIERSWFEPFKKFPLSFSEPVWLIFIEVEIISLR